MNKLLITGASGLLGKALLRKLKKEDSYEVYAVTTNKKKLQQYDWINVVQSDLTIEEERKRLIEEIKPDILIHLAWNQETENFRMSETNLLWLNISMSLLYLFEKNGGQKFLFAGSSSEYDGTEGILNEQVDVIPGSLYGLAKKTFNEFAYEYCNNRKIEYVGMRLFTIYGEEDSHTFGAIPFALRNLQNDEKVVCNSPNTTRDYIYAEDAASVVLQLVQHSFSGIVNVASGRAHTMKEVFQYIGSAMKKEDYVLINDKADSGKRFEADIQLLQSLKITGYNSLFEENIKKIVDSYTMKGERKYEVL